MVDETQTPNEPKINLASLLSKGKLVRDESQIPFAINLVNEFVSQLAEQSENNTSKYPSTFMNQRIQQIDEMIADHKSIK